MILPWRDVQIGEGPPIKTSLTESDTEILTRLSGGKICLEIGSAYGYSTVIMTHAYGGAEHVVAVDPHRDLGSLDAMQANLEAYHVADQVTILQATSQEVLPFVKGPFEFVFIDGDHSQAAVNWDLGWARANIVPGGVIAVHDYGENTCPDVKTVCDRTETAGPNGKVWIMESMWVWRPYV